jgi:CheY-like chemotaxis protein
MDLRMPGMDGYEASRRIREAEKEKEHQDGKERHIPIIALTAGVMEDKGTSVLPGVFDDTVYKPFRETELFEKIENHLGVRFTYQPSVSSSMRQDPVRDDIALTPGDLSMLPVDWLNEFFQVLKKGRSAQLLTLIEQIRPDHADLARALAEWVHIHRFDKLIHITREALKETSNG